MDPLQLHLFGSPQVVRSDHTQIHFRSRTELALLAYLAVERHRSHDRTALLGLLWPEEAEKNARNNLRVTLSRLRRQLGDGQAEVPVLIVTRQSIRFNLESHHRLDVAEFETGVEKAQGHTGEQLRTSPSMLAQIRRAIECYQGEFLAGFSLDDTPVFEEWLLLRREQFHLQMVKVLETLTAVEMALGHYEDAICYARRQIELDPLREEGYRQLMRVLAASGQRSEALRTYERCRFMLIEELGVAPSPETTALCAEIRTGALARQPGMDQETAHRAAAHHSLPVYLTPFLGREAERAAVDAWLASASCRLLTLVGPLGVGKTRLAIAVAHQTLDRFPDGVFFVDLAQIDDAALVLAAIAQVVGVKGMGERPLFDVLRGVLRDERTLLVLDNFEHVLAAAPALADLLKACLHLKLLVTSREALHISGEQLLPLSPLPVPAPDQARSLDALNANDAVHLFVQRAQSVEPEFSLTRANAAPIVQICVRLDGLPLALELAAARVNILSPTALLQQLQADSPAAALQILAEGTRDRPARHRTLRAAIAWSYSLLSDDEQRIFRQLSIFPGSFSLAAAEAVCGAPEYPRRDRAASQPLQAQAGVEATRVWQRLGSLVKKSLVQPAEIAGGEPGYRMLATIREYTREQLQSDAGEALAVGRRHAAYFVSLAEEAAPHLKTGARDGWLRRLDRALDDLRAAHRWTLEHGEIELSLRLASALSLYFFFRSNLREGRAWLEAALRAAEEERGVDDAVRLKARRELAELCCVQGDGARAREAIEECVQRWRAAGENHLLANAFINQSHSLWLQGQATAARVAAAEGLALFRALGDPWGMCVTLQELAQIALAEQNYDEARSYYEESLAINRARGDRWATGLALLGLAQIARSTGHVDSARALFDETLQVFEASGHDWMIAYTLKRVAHLACHEREYDRARALFRRCLRLWQEMGQMQGMIEALAGLACAAAGQGDAERAVRLDGAVRTLLETTGQVLPPFDFADYEERIDAARARLGAADAQIAEIMGRAMMLEDAIRYALS